MFYNSKTNHHALQYKSDLVKHLNVNFRCLHGQWYRGQLVTAKYLRLERFDQTVICGLWSIKYFFWCRCFCIDTTITGTMRGSLTLKTDLFQWDQPPIDFAWPWTGGHFEENMYLTQIRTLKAPKKSNTLHRNPKFFAKLTLSTCSSMVECNFYRQQPWLDNVFSPNYKLLTVEFKCNMFPRIENEPFSQWNLLLTCNFFIPYVSSMFSMYHVWKLIWILGGYGVHKLNGQFSGIHNVLG